MFADIIPSISTADAAALVELGLFLITVFLAYLTLQNVRAARKLIELQTEPFVYIGARWERVYMFPSGASELLVFIENRGGGPARNINVIDVKDDFRVGYQVVNGKSEELSFKQTPIVKEGIRELAPGEEMPLARFIRPEALKFERSVEVVFTYENSRGKSKRESNVLDFPSFRNSALPNY